MKRKRYEVSSSDESSCSTTKKSQKTSQANDNDLTPLEEIMKTNKVKKFNFESWKSCNTLFYDEVNSDDELWLIQCPKNTDITSVNPANLDFDSVVSTVRCRVNGTKQKLTVNSIDDFPSRANLALPNRETRSFQLKTIPVAGQLIMTKNIKKVKTENRSIDHNTSPLKSE